MEARVAGENHRFYASGASELNGLGKRSLEWDLNDWRWDGNLFIASPLNPTPSERRNKQLFPGPATGGTSNSSSSCSEESDFGLLVKENGGSEKRRMTAAVEDAELHDGAGSLTLKLGGHVYPIVEADLANWEGKNGKRLKSQGINPNRLTCQVEGCGADLGGCKDYHRRHKVCEMHAKASGAMVGNAMQRFCQQCSRFHLLQEFDEGKRSCRRRLAGHNKRRRKTHSDAPVTGGLIDNQASTYLLISLLKILSNLHSGSSDQSNQEFLSHLLKNLANFSGPHDARKLSELLQASQDLQKDRKSAGTSSEAVELASIGVPAEDSSRPSCSTSKMTCIAGVQVTCPGPTNHMTSIAASTADMPSKSAMEVSLPGTVQAVPSRRPASFAPVDADLAKAETLLSLQHVLPGETAAEGVGLKDFDLNDTYIDTEDDNEGCKKSPAPANLENGWVLSDSRQSSPPQTSGNSEMTSSQTLSSSSGDAQSRTDKIVFKLFGKDPIDVPRILRAQILDWLSHSPTDMESYIRPGCIILTVYLRLTESAWEELSHDLSSNLNRLLHVSDDNFWRRGWVYATVQHHAAFIFNGRVMLDTPLLRTPSHYRILCVTPIAVSLSTRVTFTVKGFNLAQSTIRLLCAFEGKYLLQEAAQALVKGTDTGEEHKELQCLTFSCSMPNATGRGFIEVEDSCLNSDFLPFIVAEEDMCSEIRALEDAINFVSSDECSLELIDMTHARNQALDFLNEMGWLLRRSYLRSSHEQKNPYPNVFSLTRFKRLMAYAMDQEWCAVVKKLLDILFEGTVDVCGSSPVELALSEYLLHSAVQKNSKSLVELLLRYKPYTGTNRTGPDSFLFRSDMMGPANITPLHIAATSSGSESILDALTNDPGLLGIKAWKSARDSTGFTPEDYAVSRGYESYINLVQKKIDKQLDNGHVVLNIPGSLMSPAATSEKLIGPCSGKVTGFEIGKNTRSVLQPSCKLCNQQLVCRSYGSPSLLFRPAMLSLVGIAAVCVCVGLLLRGCPEVLFVRHPFRWELIGYGTQ